MESPFQKWGLEFVGVINTNSPSGHKYILIATNYFTIWYKYMQCTVVDSDIMINLMQKLITRFGIPQAIVSKNGSTFMSIKIS